MIPEPRSGPHGLGFRVFRQFKKSPLHETLTLQPIISVSIKESEDFDWHHCQPAVPMMSKPNGAICLSEQSFLPTAACRSFTEEMMSTHAHVCARRHICCTHTKINVSKRSDTFVSVPVPFFSYFFWKARDEKKIISRMDILTFCQQQNQAACQWRTLETVSSNGHEHAHAHAQWNWHIQYVSIHALKTAAYKFIKQSQYR